MERKSREFYKLIDAVLSDNTLNFFTYKRLQTFSDLTLSEVRTVVHILCEYNIIYPKKKIGLFKNPSVAKWMSVDKFNKTEDEDNIIFKSENWTLKFNKFEFGLLESIPDLENADAAKLLTVICLAHFQINFYYKKHFGVHPDIETVLLTRRALRCSDDELIFTSLVSQDEQIIFR